MKHIVFLTISAFLLLQCREEETPIAEVSVLDVAYLTQNSMFVNVLIENIRPAENILELGVCWSFQQKPTIENDHFGNNQLLLDFYTLYDLPISGLKAGSSYYLRPYAATQDEIVYGEETTIRTEILDSLTDARDGQSYLVKQYGAQTWMVENLNYRTEGSYYFENDSVANAEEYGRLYTFAAAQEACPPGWHLPSDEEWKELEMWLGMSIDSVDYIGWRGEEVGNKMKEPGFRLWYDVMYTNATNESGFTIRPSGELNIDAMSFSQTGIFGEFWTSTQESEKAWIRSCQTLGGKVLRYQINKSKFACSIRCVKD